MGAAFGKGNSAQVQTVRGPVDTADLGQTLMHEHVFVLTADVAELPTRGTRRRGRRRGREAQPARRGRPHHRRPDRHRPGPLHPADPADRRAGRPQHHRGHRLLHLRRRCRFYFHHRGPGAQRSSACPDPMVDMFVARHHRGHRRHRRQGRPSQVRDRPPGHDPGVERVLRAVAKAHRRDRRADHRAHPSRTRPAGSRGAAVLRRGGRRPEQGRPRAQRGHHRRRPPQRARRRRVPARHGPVRHRPVIAVRGPRRTSSPRCAGAATPSRWCSRRTRPATSTGSTRQTRRAAAARTGTTCTSATTCCPRCGARRHRRADRARCWSSNPRRYFENVGAY